MQPIMFSRKLHNSLGMFLSLSRSQSRIRRSAIGGRRWGWRRLDAVLLVCIATAITSSAQTFNTIVSFDGTDGAYPNYVTLVQGTDGNLYGTTAAGGTNGFGTVFKTTTAGGLTSLYSFNNSDGNLPEVGLVQGTDGNYYGTTFKGGTYESGTVFKITATGALTSLHSFSGPDGAWPAAPLVQGSNGSLYGTTNQGGTYFFGTVYKITTKGALTSLHSFASGFEGTDPWAPVVLGSDGNFYGTDGAGSPSLYGVFYQISPAGALTPLGGFYDSNGGAPSGNLVQATDGNFYGTTQIGGANPSYGTVFQATPSGAITTLHSFASTDGANPYGGVIQATDGNFYGTTVGGGPYGYGTVFQLTPSGVLTTLHSFNGTDGANPYGGLLQATDGNFYGVSNGGGTSFYGTIFRINMGLAPFVKLQATTGKVGATVPILGTNVRGATSVSFNGTAATFTATKSKITARVPAGATTGAVQVKTPTGTLNSNVMFRVTPVISSFSPSSGPVGTSVVINGTSLTQTTAVKFGGVAAPTFTVDSDIQITAIVPAGSKTGRVVITTPGGTATSTTNFTVTP